MLRPHLSSVLSPDTIMLNFEHLATLLPNSQEPFEMRRLYRRDRSLKLTPERIAELTHRWPEPVPDNGTSSRRKSHDLGSRDISPAHSRRSARAHSRPTSKASTICARPTSSSTSTRRSIAPSSNPDVSASAFLRLPAEVRIHIYRYLLPSASSTFRIYTDVNRVATDRRCWNLSRDRYTATQRHNTNWVNGLWRPNYVPPPKTEELAILRTNKFVYFEALSVLYSENSFHFIGTNVLPVIEFLRHLSPDAKALVRQLKVTMLPEARPLKTPQLELFCRVVHEWLPGLNVLDSDSWVWI